MTTTKPPAELKQTERIQAGPGPGRGPFQGGMVGQKAMQFGPSAKRLLKTMAPEKAKVAAVVTLAVVSVGLTALGPRILGHATDLIFAGLFGSNLPAGITKELNEGGIAIKKEDVTPLAKALRSAMQVEQTDVGERTQMVGRVGMGQIQLAGDLGRRQLRAGEQRQDLQPDRMCRRPQPADLAVLRHQPSKCSWGVILEYAGPTVKQLLGRGR